MKVKVYVNWYSRKIINEKERKEKVEEAYKDYKKDGDFFGESLNDLYSAYEIWNLNEEQRKKVRSDFLIRCEELAEKDVRGDWEEKEIEI